MVCFISWNARGIANVATIRRIKRLFRSHGVSLMAIYEPKSDFAAMGPLIRKLGCEDGVNNRNNRVWVLWKHGLKCMVIHDSDQALTLQISHPLWAEAVWVSFVHASCNRFSRISLWDELMTISEVEFPWLVVGDFNCVIDQSEKIGGKPINGMAVTEFSDMIQYSNLMDAGYEGNVITWSNNRMGRRAIYQRLDRALYNEQWLQLFHSTRVTHLARTCSDHAPILITLQLEGEVRHGSFRFLNVWLKHHSFQELVKTSWAAPMDGRPMVCFAKKLGRLRKTISEWNKHIYGRIDQQIKNAEDEVLLREAQYQSRGDDDSRAALNLAQAQLLSKLKLDEDLWAQKANLKWLKEGDRNTKFFHSVVKKKRQKLCIHKIKNRDGVWLKEKNEIKEEAIRFYSEQLQGHCEIPSDDFMFLIPRLITEEDNTSLTAVPNEDEVRGVILSMNGQSAAGPDGFTGEFYKGCWDIIKADLVRAIGDFFSGFQMPRSWTSTLIVTIPKVDSPSSFTDLRPISLCNFSNKVVTKLLTCRLAPILPRIISPEQSGFVQGRVIHENVLLAQEIMQSINKKVRGSNVALKLDMAKAYDRLSWFALIKVMRQFGFNEVWIDLIFRCISNSWFSVLVNGESCGFFHSTRGLRQGDPLSPYLFIIAAEMMSRGLNLLHTMFPQHRYRIHINSPLISHLAYADDVIIFCNGSKSSLEAHMKYLDWYQNFSGQLVNINKSCFITGNNGNRDEIVAATTGFVKQDLPLLYLGCPLYTGKKKISLFTPLIRKMESRLASWKGKLLSFGAKLTLIQSCLSAMPLYYLSLIDPPKGVFRALEKIIMRFFWSSNDGEKKCHWLSWNKMCWPIEEGGLGFRKFEDMAMAFSMKLWWRLRTSNSLWSELMLAKYCWEIHPMDACITSYSSHIWKRLIEAKPLVEDRLAWRIGRGDISIHENWLEGDMGQFPFAHIEVSSLFHNAAPNIDHIREAFGQQLVSLINSHAISLSDKEDVPIWMPSSSGKFSVNSAWRECRSSRPHSIIYSYCWSKYIPKKISVFLWRALHNGLPTDERIRSKGISLASKCNCCNAANEESMAHILVYGDIAKKVWNFFSGLCGIRCFMGHLNHVLISWWQSHPNSDSNVCSWLSRLLPALILWEIWCARNKSRFEDVNMSSNAIIHKVLSQASNIAISFSLSFTRSQDNNYLMDIFHLAPKPFLIPKIRMVLWVPPNVDEIKLNTDGVSRGNPGIASGGGVFRNHKGDFVLGFSHFYGCHSNMMAEAMAARDGLILAQAHGFNRVWLEIDSQVLLRILIREYHIPWAVWYVISHIHRLLTQMDVRITHILREGNGVADGLANFAADEVQNFTFTSFSDIPRPCKGCVVLDKARIPHARFH